MRIHVLFANAMSVLVPCGDGKMTIRELIKKATNRFGKIPTEKAALQHIDGDNDMCIYLYLEDSRKIYIDHDDIVADILENDEQVVVHHNSRIGMHKSERIDSRKMLESEETDMKSQDRATPESELQPFDLVNKSELALDISPCSCDHSLGLGIKINQKRKNNCTSTTGIYITSISSDGAAAMDGRLQKNDQILSVNQHDLTGKSLKEATDMLRRAFRSAIDSCKTQLVVARTNQFAISGNTMAVLGENLEEEERHAIGTRLQDSDTPDQNSPQTGSMKSPTTLQSPHDGPVINSQTSLPSQQQNQSTNRSTAKKSGMTWAYSLPRDASGWAKQTELQYPPKHVSTLPTIHTAPMAYGNFPPVPLRIKLDEHPKSKEKNKLKRRSSSFSTSDCMDEFKYIPGRSVGTTGTTSLQSSMSLTKYDRPNYHKYRLKGIKASKENTHRQGLDLKSIQGTLTLPEKKLLDKLKMCAHRFPNLYSKDPALHASLRALEDGIPDSFDSDHPPRSKLQRKRHHS